MAVLDVSMAVLDVKVRGLKPRVCARVCARLSMKAKEESACEHNVGALATPRAFYPSLSKSSSNAMPPPPPGAQAQGHTTCTDTHPAAVT